MTNNSKTKKKFELPGAERFSHHLERICKGTLTAEGPEVLDTSYNCNYTQRYIIKQEGVKIGEYYTYGPKPGETDFGRQFNGIIPGYTNTLIVSGNKMRTESERIPENSVILSYDNKRFEAQPMHEGSGLLIDTPWQRQDFHDRIPFP